MGGSGTVWAKIEKVGKECMFVGKGVISLGKEKSMMSLSVSPRLRKFVAKQCSRNLFLFETSSSMNLHVGKPSIQRHTATMLELPLLASSFFVTFLPQALCVIATQRLPIGTTKFEFV